MGKKKKDKYNVSFEGCLDSPKSVASSTDCTGLIPTPPITDEEADSYTDLHDVPRPKDLTRD